MKGFLSVAVFLLIALGTGALVLSGCVRSTIEWQTTGSPAQQPGSGPGSTDTTFNNGAAKLVTIGEGNARILAIDIYDSPVFGGEIIAAGTAQCAGKPCIGLARFKSTGDLDTSFNPTGTVPGTLSMILDGGATPYQVDAVADGIVVTGECLTGSRSGAFIARFKDDGTGLDTSFGGGDGYETAYFEGTGGGSSLAARGFGVNGTDFIIHGTFQDTGVADPYPAITRSFSNGDFDPNFGAQGLVQGASSMESHAMRLGSGHAFVAGESQNHMIVGKFTGLGTWTHATLTSGSRSRAQAIWLDGTTNVYAAGSVEFASNDVRMLLTAFDNAPSSSPQFDPESGFGGPVALRFYSFGAGTSSVARSMVKTDAGKFLLAGVTSTTVRKYFGLLRATSGGNLDSTFGINGQVGIQIGEGDAEAYAMQVQANGKITVGGYATEGGREVFALTRITPE